MKKLGKTLYSKIADGLYTLLWEIEYSAFEVFNGLTIMALGISFLNSGFSSSRIINRVFEYDGAVLTVKAIAIVMILFGILKVVAITQHRFKPAKWLLWRRNLAGVGTFLWGFLFAVFAHYPTKPASLVFIISIIAFSMWAFIRLVLERRGQRLLDPNDSFRNE